MMLLLGLGVANVAITILGTGIPVFLERPYLAWMLGGLVPAAAMSVKSGYHLFELDRTRRIYAFLIYGFSGLLVLVWIILFAVSFEGVTGDIEWESFGAESESTGVSTAAFRNMIQIAAEILIGASLFLVIDRVQATYSARYSAKNPKWIEANKRVETLEGPTQEAHAYAVACEARTLQTQAALRVHVSEALALLRDMQASSRT